jgi:hypothetical protein
MHYPSQGRWGLYYEYLAVSTFLVAVDRETALAAEVRLYPLARKLKLRSIPFDRLSIAVRVLSC